jgi:hypothetical protein
MKFAFGLAAIAVCVVVTGCATKRYPVATPLSATEAKLYNCRELYLERVKAEEVQLKITQTAEVDWRSVAGFLGDYGIGNAMAKSEADRGVAERISTIKAAQASKSCNDNGAPPAN